MRPNVVPIRRAPGHVRQPQQVARGYRVAGRDRTVVDLPGPDQQGLPVVGAQVQAARLVVPEMFQHQVGQGDRLLQVPGGAGGSCS